MDDCCHLHTNKDQIQKNFRSYAIRKSCNNKTTFHAKHIPPPTHQTCVNLRVSTSYKTCCRIWHTVSLYPVNSNTYFEFQLWQVNFNVLNQWIHSKCYLPSIKRNMSIFFEIFILIDLYFKTIQSMSRNECVDKTIAWPAKIIKFINGEINHG